MSILETIQKASQISKDTIRKSFGIDIEKARIGVYSDNSVNRKLHRVGQKYGNRKQEEKPIEKPKKQEEGKKYDRKKTEEYAKKASNEQLKLAVEKHDDPMVKEVAKKELESRNSGNNNGKFDYDNMSLEEYTNLYKELSKKAMQAMTDNDMDLFNKLSDQISEVSKKRSEIIQKDKYEKGKKNEEDIKKLGVTDEEIIAISNYTGSGFRQLNKDLRESNKLDEKQVKQINYINNALDKLPKKEGKVYRGISIPENIDSMLSEYKKGGIITMESFTSTSESNKVAASFGAFRMEINSKTGRDISGISEFGEGEKEILFKTATKFKVKSIKVQKYKHPMLGDQITSVEVKLDEI